MYLNKAIVIGNLTRDPEMRSLPSGVPVVSFAVATSRTWKDKNGTKQEDTQYHNVVFFGAPASTIAQYMKKGSNIMVEGRMQTRSWDDKDGSKKYRTEIVGDNFQFGPKRDGGGDGSASASYNNAAAAPAEPKAPSLDTIEYPEEDINPEDIPF
jgi:single-strand DNA-binding protein